MKLKKTLSLLLTGIMSIGLMTGCGSSASQSPPVSDERKETLYVTGMAWGAPDNFNWLSGYPTWPVNIQSNGLVYEMLFMYNSVSEELEPLLGKSYTWKDDYTIEVKLNSDAKFSDEKPVTAQDVIYTFDLSKRYPVVWSDYWKHIDEIVAEDDYTLVFKLSHTKYNRLMALEALTRVPILPKHIWEKIEADNGNDIGKLNAIFNENPIGSGPYRIAKYDEQKITIERNDNYWGKSVFGKLPAPKKIVHLLFNSNDTATIALKNGELDYSENFIPNVSKLWKDGLPIKTYLSESPYYIADTMPMIYFNLHKPGLENKEVRRALAYAINYQEIIDKAMGGYSPMVEPSITVNVIGEKNMVDLDAIKSKQWSYDLAQANKILDELGAVKGADGIRVLPDGTRLGPWTIECPFGWSDWNASLEIVMQSAKEAGIELQTKFPEWPVWDNNKTTGNFDILMDTPSAYITPANPWRRSNDVMSDVGVPEIGQQAFWNYGRYHNERANDILAEIPMLTDQAKLKALYTELNLIYLEDVPTIPLMYRPTYFYTVNESVWKGFPTSKDKDMPPFLFDSSGIKTLYKITN